MAAYTVIFDACVLYPAPLRDILLQLATANLFRARWTNRIHDEWIRNLLAARLDLTPDQLVRTRALMDRTVPESLIEGFDHLIPTIALPDPDDRHVVAAAVHARADAIVTFNLKDFPAATLARLHLEAIHPDDFINFQIDLDEAKVVVAAQKCRARLKQPPKSAKDYLDTLAACQLPKSATRLRAYESVI
ncbi:MAG: PIN domain-containing protein [Proteobacteria bacterium]|nr:PIN domain-containing protein [Pseudomonadota bacterium]